VDSLEAGPIEHHHRVLVDLHHAHLPHRVRGEVEIVEVAEEFLSAGYRAIGEEALELRRHVPTEKLLVITDRCLPTGPLERRQFREQALICGVLGKGSGENTNANTKTTYLSDLMETSASTRGTRACRDLERRGP
jgi:hypothetical protein